MSRRAQVTLTVCVGVFMASLDLFIVNIAFPDIERSFRGTSLGGLSWVLNAYAITFAALLVPAGRWADRAGRKRAFMLGLGVFSLASAACAAAPSVQALVAARVVQAAGAAMLFPTSLGLLLPEWPLARRGAAVGIWSAVSGVAAAAGPPLGGVLVQAGWRWVFLVNVPIGVGALVAGGRLLRERRDEVARARPDVLAAGLFTAAIAALTLAIVKGQSWGWTGGRILGLLAGAAVLTAVVAVRCTRHPAPLIEPVIARTRAIALGNLAGILFFMGFAVMLLGGVLFQTSVWHVSVLRAGLQIAPGPLMAAVFAFPGGILGQRLGPRWVGAAGAVLFAAGGLWFRSRMTVAPHYASELLPSQLLGGAGVGLVLPTLSAAATGPLPAARFATGTAVLGMARQLGSALGVAMFVAILGTPTAATALGAFRDAWTFEIAAAGAAALVLLAVGPVYAAATTGAAVPAAAVTVPTAPAASLGTSGTLAGVDVPEVSPAVRAATSAG